MKQLFLTSSANEVAQDIAARMKTKGNKLVFIDTAAEVEEGEKRWLLADKLALSDVGFVVTDYTITDKTPANLKHDLEPYDTIFLSGGNTFYLLQQSQASSFTKIIHDLVVRQNKTYIGSSAGSIIAGSDISPTLFVDKASLAPKLQGYQGFGLVNFCIFPHWGSDYFKELYLNKRLEHAYIPNQVPLIALTDSQYVHVRDDQMEIVDVKGK